VSIFELALTIFIITNPIGNSPTIIALIKDLSIKEQQKVLFRESIFSMILAIFFLFLGEVFLTNLKIANYALTISGGVLLFVVSLKMIFSNNHEQKSEEPRAVPFIVPIATPLISGAGLLTMIMLFSKQESNDSKILLAILLAWVAITLVLVSAPYLQILLGKRGLAALEQLMGMLLSMLAIDMLVQGISLFLTVLSTAAS
jgi:multiple antibiotic resistance protein